MSLTNGIGATQQSLSPSAVAYSQADTVRKSRSGEVSAQAALVPTDAATLTATGGVLAQSLSGSETDTAKVGALQQAIAAGTYNVSASQVADKLIESMVQQG